MTTISIIVPVYQAEKYVSQCLDSLIHQNLKNYEVICIDDGSTDGSANIIKQYTESYSFIHYFYQQNKGVSAARNKGLELASGKYIMFVDADDLIEKNTLKYLFVKAENSNTDILVYGGQALNFFDTAEWIRDAFFTRNKLYENDSIQALLYESGARPSVCNKLFSRSLIKEIRFAEHIAISEDQAFLFFAFPKAKRILFCNKNVYRYRVSNDMSAMHKIALDKVRFFQNHLNTVQYILQEWKKNKLLDLERENFNRWVVSFLDIYHFLTEEQKQIFKEQLHVFSKELTFNLEGALQLPKAKQLRNSSRLIRYFHSIVLLLKKYGMKYGMKSVFLKIHDKYSF